VGKPKYQQVNVNVKKVLLISVSVIKCDEQMSSICGRI